MFIINRCFKNIWLESQMIHVALFSFQRTTLSFEARFRLKGFASSDSFIVPHLFQTVKNFFIFLFVWVIRSSKALPIKEHFLTRPVSRGDLYYITGRASICQPLSWTFSKKVAWDLGFAEMRHDTKKASLSRCSSPYGRGSWTRTNACGIQRPVPYQLGDTPVSFNIYILYGWIRHLSTHIFYFFSGISIAFS